VGECSRLVIFMYNFLEFHGWLLGPKVSLLSYLLLPLAGPEDFDEEDTQKLPVDYFAGIASTS
jgi:hypothetical protein